MINSGSHKTNLKKMKITFKQTRIFSAFIFILPGLILFLIFSVYPVFKLFEISFTDWSVNPNIPSKFIGLTNYSNAFLDPSVGVAFRNTLIYTIITVIGQLFLGLLGALLLNSITRGKNLFRTLYYLPVITSWVVVSLLFKYIFQSPSGVINNLLVNTFHLAQDPIPFLRNANTAMIPVWALGIWKGIGWTMVIFLAALQTIPKEIYESASVDGANYKEQLIHITLPLIRPTFVFTTVMLMIGGFNVFMSVFLITQGGPLGRTEVLLSYMYHQAFGYLEFGYGAAISFILAAIIIAASYIQIRFFRKPVEIV